MILMLVVDDQPHQLEDIKKMITDSGLSEIGVITAQSAYEALGILKNEQIDIVLTDIRMPEMSGIELIEKIRQTDRHVRCVLLSGYAEFEYAQQALKLRTESYLMKPVDEEELLATLGKLMRDIQAEREEERRAHQMNYAYREQLPLVREYLVRQLLNGKRYSNAVLEKRLESLGVSLKPGDPYMLLVIRLSDDLAGYDDGDLSLIRYGITNIAEEVFGSTFHILHTSDGREETVLIVWPAASAGSALTNDTLTAQFESLAKDVQRSIYRYLKHVVSVGVVGIVKPFPELLPELHARARTIVRSYAGEMSGYFASLSDLPEPSLRGSIESLHCPPSLSHLLESRRWAQSKEKLNMVFRELEEKWDESEEYAQEAFFLIAASLQYAAHRRGRELGAMMGGTHRRVDERAILANKERFKSWVFQALEQIITAYEDESLPSNRNIVDRVTRYIETNLDKDLSLTSISDEVGLHPSYLSKVFKTESGTTISEYLTKHRMDQAVALIRDTDMKVYEVAKRVGYATPHYFIRLFIRHFGLTPQDYRIAWREGNLKK